MSKKVIILSIIILFLIIGIYQVFFKKERPAFSLAEVSFGNVSQEVSETGQVKKGEKINLSFKNSGRLEKIWVVVGEKVKKFDPLAKLDIVSLKIQLGESRATLEINQAKFNKLLAGATPEEIQIAKTAVANAETSLKAAKQNLNDIKAQADENLKNEYEDAINTLDDAYLKIYNALNIVNSIRRTYFDRSDQESIKVKENKDKIGENLERVKLYSDTAKSTGQNENTDIALSETKKSLEIIFDSLKIIRETCEESIYQYSVSSTDKTSLDTQRGYINTALTNVINSQQDVSSAKLTNTANINTAQAKVDSAEGSLIAAQDELSQLTSPPRQEDVDLYRAQVNQVQAQIQLLEQQIEEVILRSPCDGEITKINKEIGEMVQLQDVVVVILPAVPFGIKVDIYEEDVVKINIDNPVDISLIAFPKKVFTGRVLSIDPAEKIIEGVVYYEIIITFDEIPEGLKPGMTADLSIKTAIKENVLIIPEDAIQKKNGKTIVEVFEGGNIEERGVEVGLEGSNDMVEIISGLKEGEKVILR